MLFRRSIAPAKTSLHSFKNEAIFDTKYSKTCNASYFIHFKDFLDELMDTLNFANKIKLQNTTIIKIFVRKKSAFFINKLIEFKFLKYFSIEFKTLMI